jgi:DNA (cytosine-5)-methyltransferase 1
MANNTFTIAETFVGCGGAHFGFKKSGNFETVFVNDIWSDAIETLKQNEPTLAKNKIICDDIKNINEEYLNKQKITNYKDVDVLVGGVVCKGFSLAGIRNPFDERNYLYIEQLRLVELMRPKISIIENVHGMLNMRILKKNNSKKVKKVCETLNNVCISIKNTRGELIALNKKRSKEEDKTHFKEQDKKISETKATLAKLKTTRAKLEKDLDEHKYKVIDDIEDRYKNLGYDVYKKVLTCSDYDCATNRKRLFIVAVRKDLGVKWKYPEPTSANKRPTVGDAFKLLDYENVNSLKNDPDNHPMKHRPSTVEKFKLIRSDVKAKSGYFSRGTSSRLSINKPAPTLVPGHSSFQIHPTEHRSITVREGAIITGFDKNFKFYGSHSSRCMQIGNAWPVNVAYHLAEQCKKTLASIGK